MKTKCLSLSLVLALLLLGGIWLITSIDDHASAKTLTHPMTAPSPTGGPDASGYVYTDSLMASNLYNWIDVASSGAEVGFATEDTGYEDLNLPQPFTFYGEDYDKIYVTTNGYATFRYIQASDIVTQCTPAERQPRESLAALCTDLVGDTVYYSTTTAYNGHQTFIIQYNSVTHAASGLTTTFQIILDLEDDAVTYQYRSVPTTTGMTTTVGIIGYAANREDVLTYCQELGGCPPQDEMAVRFSLAPHPALDIKLMPSNEFADAGDIVTYTLVISNTGDAAANDAIMTNTLPTGLSYVSGTLEASAGVPTYRIAERVVRWDGDLAPGLPVTLTYAATLNTSDYVYNTAVLSHPLALEEAGVTSSPADPWDDPAPLDTAHVFNDDLGGRRYIAVDAEGLPHVAYAGSTGLYYATLSGTVWLGEMVPGAGYGLSDAALVVDEPRAAYIAFAGDDEIRVAEQISAGGALTWTVTSVADEVDSWYLGTLDLQRGSDGDLRLVYDYGDALYYTAQSDTGWLTPTEVIPKDDCDLDSGYALALDAEDLPHVACRHFSSGNRELRLYTRTLTAPWTTYEVVTSSDTTLYYYPSLTYDGAMPHLAFFGAYRRLYHAQYDGAWQTTLVDDSAPSTYLRQGTALDIHNGLVGIAATLREGSYGNYTMTLQYAARPLTSTTWATETVATLAYEVGDPEPTLALDGDGHAHLAYYYNPDKVLRYAAEVSAFTPDVVDKSRRIRSAAVAVDNGGGIHVAWHSDDLRYAVGAAGTTTWTRDIAVSSPGMTYLNLALAVDEAETPHLAYGMEGEPLYHAVPSGTLWITRQVDLPGNVDVYPSIGADTAGSAHLVYAAHEAGDLAVRHAAFDGTAWSTETLAIAGPDQWDHWQKPQVVAQDGKVYVLYPECTAYVESEMYPIHLILQTWDGSSWIQQTLDTFVSQCNWNLDYQLSGDDDGRLAAVVRIGGEAVRPSPLVKTFWIEEKGTSAAMLAADKHLEPGLQVSNSSMGLSSGMSSAKVPFWSLGTGWMSTLIEDGLRVIQYLDQAGNPSEKIPTGEGRSRVTIEDGTGRGGTSVVVERWDDRNELTVPRTQSEVQPAACCLDTAVVPSEAAAAGCTAAPTHTDGECDTQVEVTANAAEGWIFSHWSGAASGTDATAMALMDGELPACSVATAHFIEEEATSTKRAIALPVTSGVYPDQGIYYKIDMTWLGPESAFIGIQDPYPWSRVAYITDTLDWGSYVSQCEHDDVDHEITCTGLFPESETGISTYAAFETRTTCDLYTTEDPHGSVRNTARVQIGDYIFNPVDETEVFVPFRLKASTPNFLPNSDFSPGQTVLLYTVPKGDEPDCCTSCALDVYVVVDGNTANPLKMENQAEGVADRNQADFVKDDCHHSLWFEPTEDRTYILDLYVVNQGDPFEPYYLADTLHLAPTSTPELVVYTDLRELFNEFEMTDDKSPTTDSNGNCILDYYDALARMVRYAEEQKGVLIDVRQDAYTADHVFYNSLTTRQTMGEEIDENVTAHLEGFKLYLFNIAIIGDDAVVPFYRMETPDTVFDESDYLSSYGSNGNPTLYDTQYPSGVPHGYYMSDLPYATYEATLPHDPKPNISIGRIYYETPLALSQAIEAYEQPIDVRPGKSSAALFYLANEKGLRWEDISERAIKPLLHNHYGSGLQENVGYTAPESFEKQRAYLYSGGTTPWNAITTTRRAVVDTDFVFFNSHANQFGWETEAVRRGISNTRDIDFTDLTGATMDVAISTGCHAGYNPAFYQYDGTYPLYRQNMVRAMLDHHVAYYAPSTYGYGDNTVTSHHDLLTKNFLSALFNRRYDKVGDAYYLALARYRNATGGRQDWNQYVVYSMHLFGLPTQPLKWSDATLQTAALSPSRLAYNAPSGVEDNVITISDFEVSFDDQGRAVFEVPEGGRSAKPFGPVLPVVRRSHLLPWDATNIVVTLTSSEARPYTETVEMQHSQPICYSFGPLTGTFETTGLYPTSLLTHTLFSDVGGLRLDLAVTPLRYDIDTGEVTLYDALTYRITYDSATPAALNDLRVNRAMTVATESVAVPASVTLQTPTPLSGTLVWGFEDGAGNTMGDDVAALNVDAGSTVLSWFFDTQGWQPGEKQLWVSARDEVGQVVASGSTAFKVVQKQYTVYMPLIMKE